MLDVIKSIHNFSDPSEINFTVKSDRALKQRERQEVLLSLIKDKPMHVPVIARLLGVSDQVARIDVRSLLARGKVKNLSVGRNAYFVKAV